MRSVEVGPGVAARAQFAALRLAAVGTRLVGGHGLGRIANALGRRLPPAHAVVDHPGGGRLRVRLDDGYWIRHVVGGLPYEPDLARLLGRLLAPDTAFIDCGANIGWWSVFAAQRIPGRVVAVEAAAGLYEQLRDNASLNAGAFVPVHGAVWATSGAVLTLSTDASSHAWGSVAPAVRDTLSAFGFGEEQVTSLTLRDIVAAHTDGSQALTVVKLDVEGAEIDACMGAGELLDHAALIYEDHGRDPGHVTGHLAGLGMSTYALTDGRVETVDTEVVRRRMNDASTGYNLVAARADGEGDRRLQRLAAEDGS
jgi:FkbM family methyltransferase